MNDSQFTPSNFIARLLVDVPETQPVVEEHLATYGEVLFHLLMSDLLGFCVHTFGLGDGRTSAELLTFICHAFDHSDDAVHNAIAVSFVEDVGAYVGETSEFIASWPKTLLDERQRQRDRALRRAEAQKPYLYTGPSTFRGKCENCNQRRNKHCVQCHACPGHHFGFCRQGVQTGAILP